jgi:hypothetical protein
MRRLLTAAIAIAVMASIALGAAALFSSASASASASGVGPLLKLAPSQTRNVHANGDSTNGTIEPGSTWTYYEDDALASEMDTSCEVITFSLHGKTFTGDRGDSGTWKPNGTLTFTGQIGYVYSAASQMFGAPIIYKGKPYDAVNDPGTFFGFDGATTGAGYPVAVGLFLPGDTPLADNC